jgi:hypothetical protein
MREKSFEKIGRFFFLPRAGVRGKKIFTKKANKFSIFLFTKYPNHGIIIGNLHKEKLP